MVEDVGNAKVKVTVSQEFKSFVRLWRVDFVGSEDERRNMCKNLTIDLLRGNFWEARKRSWKSHWIRRYLLSADKRREMT